MFPLGAVQTSEQFEFIYEVLAVYQENKEALDRAESGARIPILTPRDIGLSDREKKALTQLSQGDGPKDERSLIAALDKLWNP